MLEGFFTCTLHKTDTTTHWVFYRVGGTLQVSSADSIICNSYIMVEVQFLVWVFTAEVLGTKGKADVPHVGRELVSLKSTGFLLFFLSLLVR